jgi:LPS sulfotransferase NodH
MRNGRHYLVCSTHRSGSYLFCETLRATGVLGRPLEYFDPQNEEEFFQRVGASSYRGYLDHLVSEWTAIGSVFGAKLLHEYLERFLVKLRSAIQPQEAVMKDGDLLATVFPGVKYIWLTRRNKIRQAVSYVRAWQSQAWAWHDEQVAEPRYDFQLLDAVFDKLVFQEAGWQDFFSTNEIWPLTVVYEDFVGHAEETTHKVMDFLEVPRPAQLNRLEVQPVRQTDGLTEDWVARFAEEKEPQLGRSRLARLG